jgi:hypothetical protein
MDKRRRWLALVVLCLGDLVVILIGAALPRASAAPAALHATTETESGPAAEAA